MPIDRRLVATVAVAILGAALVVASLDRGTDPVVEVPPGEVGSDPSGMLGESGDDPYGGVPRPGEDLAVAASRRASANAGAGLAALYSELGLAVPGELVPKDTRPGCGPRPDDTGGDGVSTGGEPSWRPAVTVPEADLPPVGQAPSFVPDVSVMAGHGMWIWQYTKTEGGDYRRMVDKAVAAGFDHLWVRVGDSRDGFYAREYLDGLVPLAHAAGLRVIGWGFPFLHDPVGDAAWTIEAMRWVGPHGRGLDAYSPDIERETEGVVLTRRRAEVHLALLREAAGDLPVIATVYPPTDRIVETGYPYEAIAAWVDGFATMDYWNCGDSGYRAHQSIERLGHLRPVHVIGQAFNGSRWAPPSDGETWRFLDTAVRGGATGASWWAWQHVTDAQWDAIASYPWHRAVASNALDPRPAVIPEG